MSDKPGTAKEELVEPTVSTEHPSLLHYTNARGLFGILASQTLWATHFAYLNDRQEYRAARDLPLRSNTVRLFLEQHGIQAGINISSIPYIPD